MVAICTLKESFGKDTPIDIARVYWLIIRSAAAANNEELTRVSRHIFQRVDLNHGSPLFFMINRTTATYLFCVPYFIFVAVARILYKTNASLRMQGCFLVAWLVFM